MMRRLFKGLMCLLPSFPLCARAADFPYAEIVGAYGEIAATAQGTLASGTIRATLTQRPTGWKTATVYWVSNSGQFVFFATRDYLEAAKEKGYVVAATGWSESVTGDGTTLTCPSKSGFGALVICYEPFVYDIAFDANGGTGTMPTMTGLSYTNTTTCLTANASTRTGYSFAGWSLTAGNTTGTTFADQSTVGGAKFGVTADGQKVNLYAQWKAHVYKIVYDENGGAAGASRPNSATYDDTPFQVSAPTRTGYTFTGWTVSGHDATTACSGSSKTSCNAKIDTDGKISATGDIWLKNLTPQANAVVKLTALWTPLTYTIAYDNAGGSVGANITRITWANYDAVFRVDAPTRTGYEFAGWAVSDYDAQYARWGMRSDDCSKAIENDVIEASGDVYFKNLTVGEKSPKLTARWKTIGYKIAYVTNGGRLGAEHPDSAAFDEAFKISAPTQTGYTFTGWSLSGYDVTNARWGTSKDSCTWTVNSSRVETKEDAWFMNLATSVSASVTFTAKWEVIKTTVRFSFEGGSNGTEKREIAYGTAKDGYQTIVPPKKEYATFLGYWTTQTTGGEQYFDSNGYLLKDWNATETEITLYARWQTDLERTIKLDATGGTVNSASISVVIGQPYGTLPSATPSSSKKTFAGWFTSDGKPVTAKTLVPDNPPSTLYAHWTNAAYTVHFDDNGATSGTMSDQTLYFETSKTLTRSTFVRTGYTFAGWATTNAPTKVVYADGATVTDLASRGGETVTLKAVWTANTYYVAFDANGGSGTMPTLTNRYDRAVTLPDNRFMRNGFWTFVGWATASKPTAVAYQDGETISNLTATAGATITLKAIWQTSLSSLSQAMHCDNLDWKNTSNGTYAIGWDVYAGAYVGHESASCVRQANSGTGRKSYLTASLGKSATGVKGTLSFWWKPTGDSSVLAYSVNTSEAAMSGGGTRLTFLKGQWTNVVIRVEEQGNAETYVHFANATIDSSDGYCLIDGMTWTPDGTHPVPDANDAVEVSAVTMANGTLSLLFTGDQRFSYHLLATDSLTPVNWYDFGATNVGTGAAQTFDIPLDATHPQRFFKIETIQTLGD